MNLRAFLEEKVARQPEKAFLFFEDETVTYGDFDRKINQAANGFLDLGIRKGDRVCLMLGNVPLFLYAWFGLNKIGAVMVPVNVSFKENEVAFIVNHSEASAILGGAEQTARLTSLQKQCSKLRWVLSAGTSTPLEGYVPFDPWMKARPGALPANDLTEEDVAQIAYTSGTTGFPKGAVHTHRNFILAGEAFTLCAGLNQDDRLMTILPLFHANAQYYSTMGALAADAAVVLIRKFSAGHFWEQAVRYGATEFNFIGAVGKILCDRPGDEFRPDHRIRTAYGAMVTLDVYKTFTKRFGIRNVIDGYGLTEVPRVSQNPIGGRIKPGSIGLPAEHPDRTRIFSEIKVVDERGVELGPNRRGEIVVRSPVLMKEYFRDEKATREAIRDGYFYTGDIGFKDEEGYFYFYGRKKDIIRRKGENISAAEVETVLLSHPKIGECAVIPVESSLTEDEIMACVVPREGAHVGPEEIVDWCKTRLADFKIPRYVQFRSDLPKTATEKVAKYRLKKESHLMTSALDMGDYIQSLLKGGESDLHGSRR